MKEPIKRNKADSNSNKDLEEEKVIKTENNDDDQ